VSPAAHAAIERTFREEHGRVIASLVRRFGDIDVAEEAAGEALVVALERWPVEGTPPNPATENDAERGYLGRRRDQLGS
jgi:RNA polymerase sigma-70 factor, ECF subfamily